MHLNGLPLLATAVYTNSHGSSRMYAAGQSSSAFDYALKVRSQLINSSSSSSANKGGPDSGTAATGKKLPQPPVKNPIDQADGVVLPNKRTWSFHGLTNEEIVEFLFKNVIWDKYDIVALNKPYNVCCQGGNLTARGCINLLDHLPGLAARLNCAHLHQVHRLDRTSTGVLLLAKTELQAQHLKRCFKEHRIEKYYYCITRDVPSPLEGVVDIPLTEAALHADGKRRVALRPKASALAAARVLEPSLVGRPTGDSREAVTRYRVVDQFDRCALVEASPLTGCKHQIRVHLGFGLNTPVLGDHKYSCMRDQVMPQRLPISTVDRLGIKPARVRDLPVFLHAQRLAVPVEAASSGGQPLVSVIKAPFPYQFVRAMRQLKLSLPFKLMRSKVI